MDEARHCQEYRQAADAAKANLEMKLSEVHTSRMEKKKYSKAVQRRARQNFESEHNPDFDWSSVVVNEVVGFKKLKNPLSHAQRERYLRQAEEELEAEKAEAKTKTKTKAKDKADNS